MNDTAQTTPEARVSELAEVLVSAFEAKDCSVEQAYNEVTLALPRDQLIDIMLELRDGDAFRFEQLIDLCGVDYSTYGQVEWETNTASSTGFGRGVELDVEVDTAASDRFAVVYHLLSVTNNVRLRVKTFADTEHPLISSVNEIWPAANWFEREAFDLYGILFENHPDLRRILTDYGFVGHPFRKDFPLSGYVEMRYDPVAKRVIYQPVSIEPRTLVPRVIRVDNRFMNEESN